MKKLLIFIILSCIINLFETSNNIILWAKPQIIKNFNNSKHSHKYFYFYKNKKEQKQYVIYYKLDNKKVKNKINHNCKELNINVLYSKHNQEIIINSLEKIMKYQIFNIQGDIIFESSNLTNRNYIIIPFYKYCEGIYFISIITQNQKVIIEKIIKL